MTRRLLLTALAGVAAVIAAAAPDTTRTVTYEDGSWTRSHAGSIIATGCHAGHLCDDSAVVER